MQPGAHNNIGLLALRRQYTNPHGLYNTLRALGGLTFDETSQSWLVTSHDAMTTILDDSRFLSQLGSTISSTTAQMSLASKQMLFMDGEPHQRAQAVMLRPLAQMVRNLSPIIRPFAQDALLAARQTGKMEIVSEFASPIALLTIAHVLGMPAHDMDELRELERWSDTFGDVTSGYFRGGKSQDISKLENYFRRLIAEKRRSPSDDLLSAFIQAQDVFPEESDLIANCMMVFGAGRLTTKKLLGNGLSLLTENWEHYRREFKENPRFPRLLGEELLRMITPTRYLIREAAIDVDFSGSLPGKHVIRRGQRVLLFLEAANYDPALFMLPEQFNPHRRPNKHLAFGYGSHQCPGATLARMEIQIALEEVLALPNMRPKPGASPAWNPNPNLGGFISNPMLLGG